MDYLLSFMPSSREKPRMPELRELSGVSRLLDMSVDLNPNSTAGSSLATRFLSMFTSKGWNELFASLASSRRSTDGSMDFARPAQYRRGAGSIGPTLFDLPNELITMIIDQPILTDLDRIRFGSTCAHLMRNTIPVLYKYALLRYPIKNMEMYQNMKLVGHLVQELIIHVPSNVEPVIEERDYIAPYEILNRMTGLQSVTIYFDARVGPHEVTCLLKYLLSTKERLRRITLDIIELRNPMAAYESRTVYDMKRAIADLTPPGSTLPGAELRNLSICIKSSPNLITADGLRQLFVGHCEKLESLRMVPQIRNGDVLDLRPFRSSRMIRVHWIIREGTPDIFIPAQQSASNPNTVQCAKIHTLVAPRFLLDHLYPEDYEFPFPNLTILNVTMHQLGGARESFASDDTLQDELRTIAQRLFRDIKMLQIFILVEEKDGMFLEMSFRRGGDGSPQLNKLIY
ncbi:hypothetical protein TWF694_007276 [Orbilia ellipsospora]|uniref:F-box domain-containing protein n=1 Tax=Orbilia ellipsospora TaxID=2528407 RepID=A0AAV9XIP3_9PEZI